MAQPAYQRIADDLRRQIVDGTLAPGDRVPSRAQLRETYDVSDQVAIQAVRLLIAEGYLEARSGSGTYVRRQPTLQRMARHWYSGGDGGSPFRREMARQGRTGTWRVSSETSTANRAVADRLGIAMGDPVTCSQYVFLADDEPVTMSTSWEPLELTDGTEVMFPEEGPHAGTGVVGRMRAIGQDITTVQEIVTARPVLQAEAEVLDAALGTVVMVIQRTYATVERPVETADIVVPTDRYELEYTLPVT